MEYLADISSFISIANSPPGPLDRLKRKPGSPPSSSPNSQSFGAYSLRARPKVTEKSLKVDPKEMRETLKPVSARHQNYADSLRQVNFFRPKFSKREGYELDLARFMQDYLEKGPAKIGSYSSFKVDEDGNIHVQPYSEKMTEKRDVFKVDKEGGYFPNYRIDDTPLTHILAEGYLSKLDNYQLADALRNEDSLHKAVSGYVNRMFPHVNMLIGAQLANGLAHYLQTILYTGQSIQEMADGKRLNEDHVKSAFRTKEALLSSSALTDKAGKTRKLWFDNYDKSYPAVNIYLPELDKRGASLHTPHYTADELKRQLNGTAGLHTEYPGFSLRSVSDYDRAYGGAVQTPLVGLVGSLRDQASRGVNRANNITGNTFVEDALRDMYKGSGLFNNRRPVVNIRTDNNSIFACFQ